MDLTFFDPYGPFEVSRLIPDASVDLVVLWQLDFLAPIFLSQGIRTVVVPMYDASSGMPDLHWRWMQGAAVLCFSCNLAWRLSRLGLNTHLVKYFPEPVTVDELPTFAELKGFLWQRRPEDGINVETILKLFGNQLTQLHVHNAPDLPGIDGERYITPYHNRVKITTSKWGADNSEYMGHLARSNVFIAPRRSEGIGISFLEAMARGQLVVAHDSPTHNEYVANWVNGVLFNCEEVSWACFDAEASAKLAYLGWKTVVEGRERWRLSIPGVIEFVRHAAVPEMCDRGIASMLATELPKAYLAGVERYAAYLGQNLDLISAMIGLPVSNIAKPLANGHDRTASADSAPTVPYLADIAFLENDGIELGGDQARPYLLNGWSYDEGTHVWIDGNTGLIGFRIEPVRDNYNAVTISCRSPEMQGANLCMLVINEQLVSSFEVSSTWIKRTFLLPQPLRIGVNKLCIYVQQAISTSGDKRRLSLAVSSIRFA